MNDESKHKTDLNDESYHRLTSKESIGAADSLFDATEMELAESFNESAKLAPTKSDSK